MSKSMHDELVLYIYDELDEFRRKSVESKLQASASLRAELSALKGQLQCLAADRIPEKSADYGAQVWSAIASEITALPANNTKSQSSESKNSLPVKFLAKSWPAIFSFNSRLLLRAGFATMVLMTVFYLGTLTTSEDTNAEALKQLAQTWAQTSNQEIYRTQVASYLEQSNRLFTVLNQQIDDPLALTQARQEWLDEMLINNRLFRLFARNHGDLAVAGLLEQIEILLVELNNLDANISESQRQSELNNLQMRLQDQDLLYKVRYVQQQYQPNPTLNSAARNQL